jgi:Flp pilus assembly protein TadD
MSRRFVVIALIGCALLGSETIEPAVPAVASSGTSSQPAPRQLTNQFPLGPKRLCCQGTSRSRTATANAGRSSGAHAAGPSGALRGTGHASSGGIGAVIWLVLGAGLTALMGAGVAGARRGRRPPAPGLPPGVPAGLSEARPTVEHATAAVPPSAAASEEGHYRRLDRSGDPSAAFNLGVLLHQRGDVAAATAAYTRAEERGDPDAAFNLGVLLYETGNLEGARAAWRRGAAHGHAHAAGNLVFVAHRHRSAAGGERHRGAEERQGGERRGMVDELLYRRADELGGAREAFNLGVILHHRGDVAGAMAAYRRAEQRGDPDAAFNLGVLLYETGDLDAAEASWRRSADRGHPQATDNLEFLLERRPDPVATTSRQCRETHQTFLERPKPGRTSLND